MRYALLIGLLTASTALAGPVAIQSNVSYYDGADRDPARHRMDLFLPQGVQKFPTVVFVHGGSWAMGSKDGFLMVPGHKAADHGKFFAERGIAAIQINYRLSPKVKHPEHIVDVARAFAWVRRHISERGGDPDRIFIMGHSAGGHLVALLASDPKYLMAEGLTPSAIKGVIPVSGVFTLSGEMTAEPMPAAGGTPTGAGVFFAHVFGSDPAVHRAASPIVHVKTGMPPFLIAYADRDMITLPAQAVAFHDALKAKGNSVDKILMTNRTHQGILFSMIKPEDKLGDAVLQFVRTGKP